MQTSDDECLLIHFHFSLGKLGKTPEGLCKEVGIHLYASRSASKVGGLNRDPCDERTSLGFGGGGVWSCQSEVSFHSWPVVVSHCHLS